MAWRATSRQVLVLSEDWLVARGVLVIGITTFAFHDTSFPVAVNPLR